MIYFHRNLLFPRTLVRHLQVWNSVSFSQFSAFLPALPHFFLSFQFLLWKMIVHLVFELLVALLSQLLEGAEMSYSSSEPARHNNFLVQMFELMNSFTLYMWVKDFCNELYCFVFLIYTHYKFLMASFPSTSQCL